MHHKIAATVSGHRSLRRLEHRLFRSESQRNTDGDEARKQTEYFDETADERARRTCSIWRQYQTR